MTLINAPKGIHRALELSMMGKITTFFTISRKIRFFFAFLCRFSYL